MIIFFDLQFQAEERLKTVKFVDDAIRQRDLNCVFFAAILDGKEIRELTRQFLLNWNASKEARKNKNKPLMSGGLSPHAVTGESVYCFCLLQGTIYFFMAIAENLPAI